MGLSVTTMTIKHVDGSLSDTYMVVNWYIKGEENFVLPVEPYKTRKGDFYVESL